MASISRPITEFCLDLYKECNKNAEGTNIVFSPMSISIALALVELGAKHNSAAQIEKVSINETWRCLHIACCFLKASVEHHSTTCVQHFHALLLQLQNLDKRYILSLANNLFVQQEFELRQQYLMCAKELYGAILQTVDFQDALEAAREKINSWVESETQGKIKELFAPGVIDSRAVLVLVNVIYFKASWEHKFEEKNTVERDFRLNPNESKPVQMMYQKGKFKLGHIEEIGTQILELPYVQKSLSMIILLPDDMADGSTNGLEQIERAMTYEKLVLWTSSECMSEGTVEVYLPRFKLEGSFDLNLFLQAMGMTDVFLESKADLSTMSFSKTLFLSKVVHKTYVEVNEEGTIAAGATGAVIVRRSLPLTEVFMVDHPFLFFIRHNPTNTVLFFGKLSSP
uniref:Serpin family B member 11 (gene/pseudogene) n=1 Tax=Apteryx owenii TaxID=8824 RepID=A0A8B9P4T7_APTOW